MFRRLLHACKHHPAALRPAPCEAAIRPFRAGFASLITLVDSARGVRSVTLAQLAIIAIRSLNANQPTAMAERRFQLLPGKTNHFAPSYLLRVSHKLFETKDPMRFGAPPPSTITRAIASRTTMPTPIRLQNFSQALSVTPLSNRNYLLEGFSTGFRIGFQGNINTAINVRNLPSATENHGVLQTYIQSEVNAGRADGPFNSPPFQHFIVSPIGAIPKRSITTKYRIIHHLSYPHGKSVNDGIPDHLASVKYATFDDAITLLSALGRGAFMAKTDVQNAFELIPISRHDYHLLGFKFDNQYYYDKTLPMGLKSSCQIFEKFSSAIEQIARQSLGIAHITHLLDDFLILAKTEKECHSHLSAFLSFAHDMGIPISKQKTFGPLTTMTYLGIEIDSVSFEVRLPQDKLNQCREKLQEAIGSSKMTLRHIQSLIGFLNFTCQVIVPGRAFLRRLTNLTRGISRPHFRIRINAEAKKDLLAWIEFMSDFNGKSIAWFDPWTTASSLHLFTDAAQSTGYGALFNNQWFYGAWPESWKTKSISLLELFPIVLSFIIWGPLLQNKRIIIHTDNQALVPIINKSSSKHADIMLLVRKLVASTMRNNIQILAQHIPGKQNILSDHLSRFQIARFHQLAPWADRHPTHIPCHVLPQNWPMV